ncbi:MAG: tyrosine-type recombinase/integrase [Rhodobacter sp.]|nr:tyrosine-type recombinase/integrase [Rhodobacter sp.]
MGKKPRRNGAGWNKDKAQGQKRHFTLDETIKLATHLQRTRQWHDLALLTVGLDTMLRASDLLKLTVADVTYSTGAIRTELHLQQRKTRTTVQPTLTVSTKKKVARWIEQSGKTRRDYLFTRFKPPSAAPICHKHLVSLVKGWAVWLGHPPDDYAAHSLRRSKAIALYRAGAPIAELSEALGHKTQASTMLYLGITQERVRRVMLSLDMTSGFAGHLDWGENAQKTLPEQPLSGIISRL